MLRYFRMGGVQLEGNSDRGVCGLFRIAAAFGGVARARTSLARHPFTSLLANPSPHVRGHTRPIRPTHTVASIPRFVYGMS